MNVEEYRNIIHDDIANASTAEGTSEEDEFLKYATDILIKGEEFDDFIECKYEGITRRKGNMRVDGYAKDDTDGSCCVFITDYHGPKSDDSVKSEEIGSAFRKIRLFIEEAIKNELYAEMKGNASSIDFARDLYYDSDSITKYRFYLLTDAFNRQRTRTIKDETIGDKAVELNVWDISRLFELVSSRTQKESIEIILSDYGFKGIPCVKAVDYERVTADIEAPTGLEYEEEKKDNEIPYNVVTYKSYLAVVPGEILNTLYLEYGAKLLEGNVRSFLSVRGKVNKGIQGTIKNYPEMFFAYNNGIAATATELDTEMTAEGPVITRIKDLQIVNGGQTTASIANTILTAKKNENVDISNLFVPMKISVLEHSMAERIIPKISEYSNSQNKVDASDFFSNHPFHIRMETFSRKTRIPSSGGYQGARYWFYERTRGQYNQGKMKYGARSSQLKEYLEKYPEKQVITMLDLARYMELYECEPAVVSRGKQKTLQYFAENIKKEWDKSNKSFNEYYYKRMVAIAIMYRRTDEIIKNTEWYKEKKSYKANVIAYTLALIFNYIKTNKPDYELDFLRIWDNQDIYEELENQISDLCGEVYEYITGPRATENVTEWCKKDACWSNAKEKAWTINNPFVYSLVSKADLQRIIEGSADIQETSTEVDDFTIMYNKGQNYWKQLSDWGTSRGLLSDKEISILRLWINMYITGRSVSPKQQKAIADARKRLIKEGMPLEFS